MHRFFISQSFGDSVDDENVIISDPLLTHQIVRVLRFKVGDEIIVLDNSGYEFQIKLNSLTSSKVIGEVVSKNFCETELSINLIVAQNLLKNPDKFEYVLQKGTELGVNKFIPLISERTERKFLGKLERLQRILKESAEQSGRGKVPEISDAVKLEKVFQEFDAKDTVFLILHPFVKNTFIDFAQKLKSFKNVVVLIGPEGGFSEKEIEFATNNGAFGISLGKRILRSETAVTVISTLLNHYLKFF